MKLVLLLFLSSGVWAQNNPAPAQPAPPPGAQPATVPAAAPPPTTVAPPPSAAGQPPNTPAPQPATVPAAAPPPTTAASDDNIQQLALRMTQLMESTAVPVPGLIQASQPIKQRADTALAAMKREPANPLLVLDFMEPGQSLPGLADSIPRPEAFPPTADRQYAELREALDRMQRQFMALLKISDCGSPETGGGPEPAESVCGCQRQTASFRQDSGGGFPGDSIFDSWRLNEYFTGRDFLNRAIAGQTSSQMLARFIPDVSR